MDYYNEYSDEYCIRTFALDMSLIYSRVTPFIPPLSRVLDVGCGSGRDSLYFHNRGHMVSAIDSSPNMVQTASCLTDHVLPITVKSILDLYSISELTYNLIWCSASFIQIGPDYIRPIMTWLIDGLVVGGVIYVSFKKGNGIILCDGMLHYTIEPDRIVNAVKPILNASIVDLWVSEGPTSQWINVIIRRDRIGYKP